MFNAEEKYKSYAFFDVIGIKKALLDGTAIILLDKVWKAVDEWTTHKSSIQVTLDNNRDTLTTSEVKVFVVSDSIFLSTKEEYTLESFYTIVDSLREYLIKKEINFYAIINRDTEIHPHSFPPTGASLNNFFSITGSGAAWGNIYLADEELKNLTEWKRKYKYFVVGEKNIISSHPVSDSHEFSGINSIKIKLLSIE